MPRKLTYEEVKAAFEAKGLTLISTEYVGSSKPLQYKCKGCGGVAQITWNAFNQQKINLNYLCTECSLQKKRKRSIEDIRLLFQKQGAVLLSDTYVNESTPLRFKCSRCGNEHKITYDSIRRGRNKHFICMKCSGTAKPELLKIKESFALKGAKLLTTYYKNDRQPLYFVCSKCDNVHYISWTNYNQGYNNKLLCMDCMTSRPYTFSFVEKYFKDQGVTLLSSKEDYENGNSVLRYACKGCGKELKIRFRDFYNKPRTLLCQDCQPRIYPTIDFLKKEFEQRGSELLSTEYVNCEQPLEFKCTMCGKSHTISWNAFRSGSNRYLLCTDCIPLVWNHGSLGSLRDRTNLSNLWFDYIKEFYNVSTQEVSIHHIIAIKDDQLSFDGVHKLNELSLTNGYPLPTAVHRYGEDKGGYFNRLHYNVPGNIVDQDKWSEEFLLPEVRARGVDHFLKLNKKMITTVIGSDAEYSTMALIKQRVQHYKQGIIYLPFFIFEMYRQRQEIVYSMVRNRLYKFFPEIYDYTNCSLSKYGARKLTLQVINKEEAQLFFKTTHIQGYVASKYYIALKNGIEIICAAAFSNRFQEQHDVYELTRFSTKLNTIVNGGLAKIVKYFINSYHPRKIVSFCDARFCDLNPENTVYAKIGFEYEGYSRPNYRWVVPNTDISYSRQTFQKKFLKKKLEVFDENLSESENMRMNGYVKQYDCGNYKFVWRASDQIEN